MARVLVVEDNYANQRLVRMILESMGHAVICATTGEEGWTRVQEEPFDLVLLDMHLPGLDGYELAGRIKGHRPELQVVAVTACAMDGDRARVLDSGCDGYISKPISVPDLRQCVEEKLDASRRGPGPPQETK
jgi:two-component system, cell cycle response regulator DivK